jgi:hypothetical protein
MDLKEEYAALRRRLEATATKLNQMESRLGVLEAAHAASEARFRELQDENTRLVQLSVANQLLTGISEREDVLSAIEEIVVNMIGSEELAIFEVMTEREQLVLARHRGVDLDGPLFQRARGPLRDALHHARTVLSDRGITAAIPLKVDGAVLGVVLIFRLLEQKSKLDEVDLDIFELLSKQAAVALYASALRSLRPTVRPPRGFAS